MKKAHRFIFTIPAGLLFLTVAAYGILSPWMGYYWDDWSFAWLLHFRGPANLLGTTGLITAVDPIPTAHDSNEGDHSDNHAY